MKAIIDNKAFKAILSERSKGPDTPKGKRVACQCDLYIKKSGISVSFTVHKDAGTKKKNLVAGIEQNGRQVISTLPNKSKDFMVEKISIASNVYTDLIKSIKAAS